MTSSDTAARPMPTGEGRLGRRRPGPHRLEGDVPAKAKNDSAIRRSARRSRDSGSGWRNCHKMISPLLTSTTESSPNPTSATDPATMPAMIAMTASTRL